VDISRGLEKGFDRRNGTLRARRAATLTYSGASDIVTADSVNEYMALILENTI
jgi:hypothetical protein